MKTRLFSLPIFVFGSAFALDQSEWINWNSQIPLTQLRQIQEENPNAIYLLRWDQNWLFSSREQAWDAGDQAKFWGFPYSQSFAIGVGDTLKNGNTLRIDYRYQRLGWSQDDFLFLRAEGNPSRQKSVQAFNFNWSWEQVHLMAGPWMETGNWTAWSAIGLGPAQMGVIWDQNPFWNLRFQGEKRLKDTLLAHQWQQYLPVLSLEGQGAKWSQSRIEQNIWNRRIYVQGIWNNSGDQGYLIRASIDPSRLVYFDLGASQVQNEWKMGASLNVACLSLAYSPVEDRLDHNPWGSVWSMRIHFGIDGFSNRAVERPSATEPSMPAKTVLEKKI